MNWSAIVINAVEISALIFLLMVFVEIVELRYSGWLRRHFVESRSLKYVLSSLIGSIPGCTGSFLMDTLYMAGIAGFGSLVSTMITSMGDEAFYLISLAAQQGNLVSTQFLFAFFAFLFFIGIIGGGLADVFVKRFRIDVSKKCGIDKHVEIDCNGIQWGHFIRHHVWKHIISKHIIKIFIWIVAGLTLVEFITETVDLQENIADNKVMFLFLAGVVGIIPLSGPNIIIISFFAEGIVPFSILLTNSIVQEGHGLLPILGFSLEDSLKIKLFKLVFGCAVGAIVLTAGY